MTYIKPCQPIMFVSVLVFMFAVANGNAQSFEKYKLTESEIPRGYKPSEEIHCKSIQVATFYEDPGMHESLMGKIKSKSYQSFDSKHDPGTIFYFEFEDDFTADSFLSGLLWGGDKPTKEHPEGFWSSGNILIIWCFPKKSILRQVSIAKVKNAP